MKDGSFLPGKLTVWLEDWNFQLHLPTSREERELESGVTNIDSLVNHDYQMKPPEQS